MVARIASGRRKRGEGLPRGEVKGRIVSYLSNHPEGVRQPELTEFIKTEFNLSDSRNIRRHLRDLVKRKFIEQRVAKDGANIWALTEEPAQIYAFLKKLDERPDFAMTSFFQSKGTKKMYDDSLPVYLRTKGIIDDLQIKKSDSLEENKWKGVANTYFGICMLSPTFLDIIFKDKIDDLMLARSLNQLSAFEGGGISFITQKGECESGEGLTPELRLLGLAHIALNCIVIDNVKINELEFDFIENACLIMRRFKELVHKGTKKSLA